MSLLLTKKTMLAKRTLLAATLAGSLFAAVTVLAGNGFDLTGTAARPAESIDYVAINEAISMGTAWGDRAQGAHGTFGTFPPQFQTPLHTHSGAYHGVVIEGVMTNPFEGVSEAPEMGPGSYWYVPSEAAHSTACVSETPCRFYFTAAGAFDFKPVDTQ